MVSMTPDCRMLQDRVSAQQAHRKSQGKPGFCSLLSGLLTPRWGSFYCSQTRDDLSTRSVPEQKLGNLCSVTPINEEWFGGGCSDLEVGVGRGSDDLQKALASSPLGGWSCGFPKLD